MEKNCIDCSKTCAIEDGVIECEADKYDIHTKSCFVPKICNVEKNQRLVEHIMEFDAQGKEYDWYEQHIALIPKIVKCIKCEYWGAYTDNGKPNGMGHCGHPNILMPTSENFFCGFGKPKDEEE